MEKYIEEQLDMIADCMGRESRMSEWEFEFISSIDSQMNDAQPLSTKQAECLERLWEKVTAGG